MNFLNAELHNGALKLFGQTITMPSAKAREGNVVVGLRPEHLILGDAPVTFTVRRHWWKVWGRRNTFTSTTKPQG